MKKFNILLCAAVAVLATAACNSQSVSSTHPGPITAGEHTQVATIYGTVEGYLDDDVYTFKGIQYAKADRFKAPEFPDSFEGVRMSKIYGPKAPQGQTFNWRHKGSDYDFGNNFVMEPMDEANCLVLNVWTKGINDGKKRPVFVWFHGGGYATGSGHDLPCYEGRSLADKGDIVTVTVNHRLNVLGFTDMSGLGGEYADAVNVGAQDMVKSLEWIRDNIEKFGGDPAQVTIGGQSGGGGKIGCLMGMPSAKGLFRGAIIQSGMNTSSMADNKGAQQHGLALIEELGLKKSEVAEKVGSFSYEEIVAASNRASRKLAAQGIRGGGGPVADGTIIPAAPFGEGIELSKDIPLMIGTNFNEFNSDISQKRTEEEVREQLARRIGEENVDAFVEQFKKAFPNEGPEGMLYMDTMFRGGMLEMALNKSKLNAAPVYLYQFTWKPENNVLGANHGMELPFMFDNVELQREMTGSSESAYKLEDVVSNYWLAFIKTGDPNVKGQVEWEPYTEAEGACMILDNTCEIRYNHDKPLIDMLSFRRR